MKLILATVPPLTFARSDIQWPQGSLAPPLPAADAPADEMEFIIHI